MFKASSFKLTMYETCPQQYKFTYIDHLADEYKIPKPYLTMGAHVHNALKDFYEQLDPAERNYEHLEQLLRTRWRENRRGFTDAADERNWGLKALQMLKNYAYKHDLTQTPVLLEDYYDMDLSEDIKLLGRIDRADATEDGLHVIDYKTGQYVPEDISDTQLIIYAMIVQANTHQPVTKASFLYLADDAWYSIDISDDMFANIANDLIARVEQIKQDQDFLPNINKYCRTCDFIDICPKAGEVKQKIAEGTLVE